MRLSQIKLAGFKSFVDPTVIATPSQLVGVVGPNGCGKSNIIDAVRWVLGESRASELRGDSMQDVIFNGSVQRRPANRASVELVFDNSAGRAAGQWNAYAEIAIRRVLTRDAGSTYFINGQAVRRRDVHDIFLGTGLGVRGYAIIGQGMINRLIEARPEELRVFLEEAAGVSRYKERRRETENRLAATRENLQRLDDILAELAGQLDKLSEQASVARHYQSLQDELQQKQLAYWLIKEKEAIAGQKAKQQAIASAQLRLDEALARLRQTEASIETHRQAHYQAADRVHAVQGLLFEAGAQVSRLEADIRHIADARQRLEKQLEQTANQLTEWAAQETHCASQLDGLQTELDEAIARNEEAEERAAAAEEQLPGFEQEERTAVQVRNRVQDDLNRLERALALHEHTRTHAVGQYQVLMQKRERLTADLAALAVPDPEVGTSLAQQVSSLQQERDARQQLQNSLEKELPALEAARQLAQDKAREVADGLGQLQARLMALQGLQEDAHKQEGLGAWLDQHGMASWLRLWQQIDVEPGWEAAVEAVLGERLGALGLPSLETVLQLADDPPPAPLLLHEIDTTADTQAALASQPVAGSRPAYVLRGKYHLLIDKIHSRSAALHDVLKVWLDGVYIANNWAGALADRSHLLPHGLFVLQSGHRIGVRSVAFYAPKASEAGQLARQNEVAALTDQLADARQLLQKAESAVTSAQAGWFAASQQLSQLHSEQTGRVHRLHQTELELSRWRQQVDQLEQRRTHLHSALDELMAQVEEVSAAEVAAETEIAGLEAQQAGCRSELDRQHDLLARLSEEAAHRRQAVGEARMAMQAAAFEERSVRARMAELRRNLDMARHQSERGHTEINHLQDELSSLDASAARAALEEAVETRAAYEAGLAAARTGLDAIDAELRSGEQQRIGIEQSLDPLRTQITELQLQEQAARLAVEQYAAELDSHEADRAALQQQLDTETTGSWHSAAWLQSEQSRLRRQIEGLGPVNLAALEELNQARERQSFLGSQHDDLTQAINTLEDAIRKIDRETRELLRQTFDAVNQHFGELFPRLFGGGQAYLTMTGDEILDAGVQLMAQPPGKRNSTIHLLSGGEKALTAIALVFAFFRLNPAPFCLLDEVDAPLDDANTGRYADLVRSMSDQTQFFFISHNKIAMQMAKQLVGVTMQEQGVSRIVAVDIETAIQMAAQ